MRTKLFKISEVLSWQPQKEIDPLKLCELAIEGDFSYPFYGQATINNGIISFQTLTPDVLNNKDGKPTILIHSNNQNIVYLETPFYLKDGHGATSVLQSDKLNEKNALYIITCIKKVITKKFAYNEKATKIALKNTYIELPITESDEIDYDFMEKCINELEEKRIDELSAYLSVSGMDKYTLTKQEKNILNKLNNKKITFSTFKIVDVFDVKNAHSILKSEITLESGDSPYVTAGEGSNSIASYITYKPELLEEGNSIMIGGKTLVITYQPKDYYSNDSHNLALYIKDKRGRTEKAQLFMVSALYRSLKPLYTWGDSISKKKIQNDLVSLPVNTDGKIDFNFMEDIISILEKIAIKGVVNWKDKKQSSK